MRVLSIGSLLHLCVLFGVVVVAVLFGSPARAEPERRAPHFREIGIHLSIARSNFSGSAVVASEATRTPIHGASFGGFTRIDLFCPPELGLCIGVQPGVVYTPRGADTEMDGVYLGGVRTTYLDLPVLLRVNSPEVGAAVFYAVVGPVPSLLLTSRQVERDRTSSDGKDTTSLWDVGLAVGLGTTVSMTRLVGVTLEARYMQGFQTIPRSGSIEVLNRTLFFTLGVGAHFGVREALFGGSGGGGEGEGDRDRDGVPDERDACVEPEDRDGFMDEDGCPDPDNDVDGVPDARDACPDRAEDEDDVGWADGCPASDRDGDGVPDGGSAYGQGNDAA